VANSKNLSFIEPKQERSKKRFEEVLKTAESINGFLIGGASQNSKNFIDIVKKTYS